MKLLVVASVDGNLMRLNNLFLKHPEVAMAISLGDMNLFSATTPIGSFLRQRYRSQAKQAIKYNTEGFEFRRPVYHVYGSMDDPFIPEPEFNIQSLHPVWQSILPLQTETKTVNVALFGGYYNNQSFKATNPYRSRKQRKKQSLTLCGHDFEITKNAQFDYLFSYESPYGKPLQRRGCPALWPLVDKAKLSMYGHHRVLQIDDKNKLIGLPQLEYGYMILNIEDGQYTVYFKPTGHTNYSKMQTGGV